MLEALIATSAWRTCSGWESMRCSATPDCTLISDTWWASTSCTSRAMRSRSSPARRLACSSRVASAWTARSLRALTISATTMISVSHATANATSLNPIVYPLPVSVMTTISAATQLGPAIHATRRLPCSTALNNATTTLRNTGP